jgi:hypothetical protein
LGSVVITAAELAEAQATAETMMQDTCTITRGSEQVFNATTGKYEPGPGTSVYSGICRVQSVRAQASNPEAGGAVFTVERVELQVPFGTALDVGDAVLIDSSVNPVVVGNRYRVTGQGEKTHATSARYNVESVS